ncbi:hypothetical protein ANO14919_109850 [Xylariales sp. No.14919]|nr:hypothetical protein ANO14919_109850 [Xylariales sp. No.14919]
MRRGGECDRSDDSAGSLAKKPWIVWIVVKNNMHTAPAAGKLRQDMGLVVQTGKHEVSHLDLLPNS